MLGPGYTDVEASVQKDIALGGGTRLELRWEIFNLLDSVNFGRIFSAQPARQMQFGVKVIF